MRKITAVAGSAVFPLIAPGGVAGLVPWWLTGWRMADRIFQLRVAGLQGEFPPLRTVPGGAAAATRTLPRDLGSFTGRQQELDELVDAAAGAGGVVGIHAIDGMAGIGKTTLAVHAAHRLAAGFPDGQFFLPLHAHTPGQRPVEPADALASLLLTAGVLPSWSRRAWKPPNPGLRLPAKTIHQGHPRHAQQAGRPACGHAPGRLAPPCWPGSTSWCRSSGGCHSACSPWTTDRRAHRRCSARALGWRISAVAAAHGWMICVSTGGGLPPCPGRDGRLGTTVGAACAVLGVSGQAGEEVLPSVCH